MKLKVRVPLASICGLLAAVALPLNTRGANEPTPPALTAKSPTRAADLPALTRTEALKIIAAARRYVAHPAPPGANGAKSEPKAEQKVAMPDFEMAAPPPAPRPETKPAAPDTGLVWVAGHYMPVEGEWRWVQGEWAVPALPISVWIQASYDAKEKKWTPGYWQPDRPVSGPAEPATKAGPPAATPPGY